MIDTFFGAYRNASDTRFGWFSNVSALAIVGSAITITGPAHAQELLGENDDIGANLSEYEPVPVRIGPFEVFPRIDAELEYNDNVFAADGKELDDFIVSIVPAIVAQDRREDRVITFGLLAGVDKYLRNTFDTQFRGRASAEARWGLGTGTRPFVSAMVRQNNSRGQLEDEARFVAQPVKITTLEANGGLARDFGRFTGTAEATVVGTSFDGTFAINGDLVNIGLRDYQSYTGRLQLAYSRSDNQRVFGEIILLKQNFDSVGADGQVLPGTLGLNRSSEGFRIQAGYSRRLTQLLSFTGRVGYLRQSFDAPEIGVVGGVAFEGELDWRPTALTQVRASALRAIDQRNNPLLAGALRTEFAGGIDHELLRNLSLFANARFAFVELREADDTVTEWNANAGARYRFDRNWSLAGQIERFQRDSLFDFSQNRAIISVRYNY